ncbi:MAG TPA: quinone oxidoreductase [Methylomirabilota bacterium]|nr:quinone oxidoreductase [Methylomirabilota bacterium]
MVKAVRVHEVGGPSAMRIEEVDVPAPGGGEARIRHTAIGVNFIDTYYRSGLYKAPSGVPFVPGAEAAGVVTEVGEGVTDVAVGQRVVYAGSVGAYAEERVMPTGRLVPIPDDIEDKVAAACLLKGLTAQYLIRRTFRVEPEHTVLFHAGAGGVGLIAGQWLKSLGCTSISTAGSPEKVELAREAGYGHVISYRTENFVERVAEITGGEKCHVVYDSVGKDTFPGSLDCIRPLGMFVTFGNASGPVPAIEPLTLAQKGSLFMTRPTLATYTAQRADLLAAADDLFAIIRSGAVRITIGQTFALDDVVACHEAMESRRTTGSTIQTL